MPPAATLLADGVPTACAICGGPDTRLLYVKWGYGIGACPRCGLVYANPRPPREKVLARYSPTYFWSEYLPSLGVVEGRYDLTLFDRRHAPLLQMMAARAPGRHLLEVGCGAGFFLAAARRAGWNVEGIELSDEAARFAIEQLELKILREPAESAPIPPAAFDAAGMFDVIEHLFDPRTVLTALARALVPGGLLVVSTPNFDAASRRLLGVDWAVLSPLEHLYYFTEDSLRRLLEDTGFTEVTFVRQHVSWGPQETMNFDYTHAPGGLRARVTEAIVRAGGTTLAHAVQRAGHQDALLCLARKAGPG